MGRVTRRDATFLRASLNAHVRVAERVNESGAPCVLVWFADDGRPHLFRDEIAAVARVDELFASGSDAILLVAPRRQAVEVFALGECFASGRCRTGRATGP